MCIHTESFISGRHYSLCIRPLKVLEALEGSNVEITLRTVFGVNSTFVIFDNYLCTHRVCLEISFSANFAPVGAVSMGVVLNTSILENLWAAAG